MARLQRLSPFYNKEAAGSLIDKLSTDRQNAIKHLITLAHDQDSELNVFEEQNPRFFKIVHVADQTEAVFWIVGAVTVLDMDYPNREDPIEIVQHKAQHLKIVGFTSTSFDDAITNIEKLHWQIHRHMSFNSIKPMPVSRYNGHRQLHFKCQFFTTGEDTLEVANVTPADHVDTTGILSHFTQDPSIRHGAENRVVYRKLTSQGYISIPPSAIKLGDVVEVEFSVLGAPSHREGGNFILIHSRVTLLDETIAMEAFLSQCKADTMHDQSGYGQASRVRVKRRQLEEEESDELAQTRVKMARLNV